MFTLRCIDFEQDICNTVQGKLHVWINNLLICLTISHLPPPQSIYRNGIISRPGLLEHFNFVVTSYVNKLYRTIQIYYILSKFECNVTSLLSITSALSVRRWERGKNATSYVAYFSRHSTEFLSAVEIAGCQHLFRFNVHMVVDSYTFSRWIVSWRAPKENYDQWCLSAST